MIFLDELEDLKIHNKKFYLPINEKDKRYGSLIYLLTPDYNSSNKLMNSNLIINKYFNSYYIEKDITYYINQEGYINLDNNIPYNVLNEDLRRKIIKVKDHPLYNYIDFEGLEPEDNIEIRYSNNKGINRVEKLQEKNVSLYNTIYDDEDNEKSKSNKVKDDYEGLEVDDVYTSSNDSESNKTKQTDRFYKELKKSLNENTSYPFTNCDNIEELETLYKENKIDKDNDSEEVATKKAYYQSAIRRQIYRLKNPNIVNENVKIGDNYSWKTIGGDKYEGIITDIEDDAIHVKCIDGIERAVNRNINEDTKLLPLDLDEYEKYLRDTNAPVCKKCGMERHWENKGKPCSYCGDTNIINYSEYIKTPNNIYSESSLSTGNIYHLSQSNLDGKIISPSIPDNYMTKNGYEENKTPRISFAKSIDGCLKGLSRKCKDEELYVHVPDESLDYKTKNITNKEVPDASITKEIWVTTKVKLKCIGKIKVIGDAGEDGIPYKYGNKIAELYKWNWKWIKRSNIIKESSLSSKDRKNLEDKDFGIPELRKYPLVDKEHVLQAIRYFNKVEPEYEKELAKNIVRRMKELKMNKVFVGDANKFYKYWYKAFREDVNISIEESAYIGKLKESYTLDDAGLRCIEEGNQVLFLFNENLDEIIEESNKELNPIYRKILYKERFKNNKEVFTIYDKVKKDNPWINLTFLNYNRYKKLNLFVDLSFYNKTFFKNNIYRLDKGVELYFEFIDRFINDKRIDNVGYNMKTVFIPVMDWTNPEYKIYNYTKEINPVSMIYRKMQESIEDLQIKWKDIDFVFISNNGYFKMKFNNLEKKDLSIFKVLIDTLQRKDYIPQDEDPDKDSVKAIKADIIDKIETSQNITINNLTGDSKNINKDELIKKIDKAAISSKNTEEALDKLDNPDSKIKEIIDALSNEEENNVKINAARQARITQLQNSFLSEKINGTPIRDMLKIDEDLQLPKTSLNLDTINDEWKDLSFINFNEKYNVQEDIMKILNSFSKKTLPVAIRNVDIVDNSTSEDYLDTYTINMEDSFGKRFTVKFDMPKLIDNKFLVLRGNEKTINGQLMLLPITKTDDDTVQVVSNYNKIFIERFGTSSGKSFVVTDRILKALKKDTYNFKVIPGDNSKICSLYELPIDYIDLAKVLTRIESKDFIIYFNQDEIRNKYKDIIDDKKGIPFAYSVRDKSIFYYSGSEPFSYRLLDLLTNDQKFREIYESTSVGTKYTYSKASILNSHIPLVIIMAYCEGLLQTMTKANIRYNITEKRPQYNKSTQDIIRFKDGYILYFLDYNSSLLMNGLKECNTEDYSLSEINKKSMYIDFLELYGNRILSDGLDNFYDLMIDPITEEVLMYYKLPTDFVSILAYANQLLSDNKYISQTDLSGKRYRSNEILAGYMYKAISEAYGEYRTSIKRNRKGSVISMKPTKVLDNILLDPTASDLSTLNAILDIECINAVSPKGLSGMNSDRSYSLDKRTYDDTMLGILGMATGFAGNVGITRQAVIDMNVEGKRGYLKINTNPDKLNTTKALTVTEALNPFVSECDDPFRQSMGFIQTAKHGVRVRKSSPILVSNGADMALPYLISNKFAFKAKQDGKIIEKTDEYLVIEYKDGTHDFVDLREVVKKNSDGGFFVTLKLDTELNLNSKVTKNQIVAYDKLSFSKEVGDDLAYNLATNVKIAILNTDEGYEDSAIISDYLSDALASEIVVCKPVTLPKNTNIYNMAKIGDPIQEGDPLLIYQNAFDDEDVNVLLKNLVDDEELISDLGRVPIRSKITGKVQDIKILRTVDKNELSDSIRKKVDELEKPNNKFTKLLSKYDIEYSKRYIATTLDSTGKLKNAQDKILIEFYLKYYDKMSVGDKIIYYSALKGVIKDIFPKGQEPYTDFRSNEKIHSLLALGSPSARMTMAINRIVVLQKLIVELDRSIKDMVDIPWTNMEEL